MSAVGNSSIGVIFDKTGKQYKANNTGTTVAGVVAGGASLDGPSGAKPVPGPSVFGEARAKANSDPTITTVIR